MPTSPGHVATTRRRKPSRPSASTATSARSGPWRWPIGRKQAPQPSGHWNRWYRRHEWKRRAESYDAHLDEEKRQAEAEAFRARGQALVEKQFRVAEKLLARAEEMLKFPLVEQTVTKTDEDGRAVEVTIEPARWNLNSAARLAKVGVELGRLAAGLPTKHEKQTVLNVDVSRLTDEQLDRIAAGESPEVVLATGSTTPLAPGEG